MSAEVDKLLERMKEDNIQFVRFEVPSITGTAIGMLVPARNCEHFLCQGFPFCAIALMQTANTAMDIKMLAKTGYRNIPCFADASSYKVIPWQDMVSTASVMMAQPAKYDDIYATDVRTIAQRQLKLLSNVYKLNLLSSIEHEFVLLDNQSGRPISKPGCYHLTRISKYTEFFGKVDANLRKMGIEVDRMHSEVASGQYEITALPAFNIKGADDAYWIRNVVQEMADKYLDSHATFVTHLYSEGGSAAFSVVEDDSGAHFNFSLYDNGSGGKVDDKNNVLWDDAKSELSETARYFIGGIIDHCRALCAFCCPTTICYATRFDSPWVSTQGNWGKYNRTTLIHVKPSAKNTHFEFRMPSSLANPYLVLAGVICAGCDGLKRKILPPKETLFDMVDEKERIECFRYTLPKSLDEALDALNADRLFSENFGELFVRQYIVTKRLEIKEMDECKRNKMKPICYSLL